MLNKNDLPLSVAKYINENLLRGEAAFTYNIKMFWFGRFDKLRHEDTINLDWISEHVLRKELGYKGKKANSVLLSDSVNYEKEARSLFESLKTLMK